MFLSSLFFFFFIFGSALAFQRPPSYAPSHDKRARWSLQAGEVVIDSVGLSDIDVYVDSSEM